VAGIGVSIAGLRVERGGRPVLHDISRVVLPGQITGLLGPSGCGKTTLMRAIVGVQRITGGRIDVLGLPAGTVELRRRVGYMTESPAIYSDLTVAENLRYFGVIVGASASRSADLIELVHLEAKARTPLRDLSGGERSRVSLCVALLGVPAPRARRAHGRTRSGAGTVWAALVALAVFSGDPRAERAARPLTITPAAAR